MTLLESILFFASGAIITCLTWWIIAEIKMGKEKW
jgi:hypothetical protein